MLNFPVLLTHSIERTISLLSISFNTKVHHEFENIEPKMGVRLSEMEEKFRAFPICCCEMLEIILSLFSVCVNFSVLSLYIQTSNERCCWLRGGAVLFFGRVQTSNDYADVQDSSCRSVDDLFIKISKSAKTLSEIQPSVESSSLFSRLFQATLGRLEN